MKLRQIMNEIALKVGNYAIFNLHDAKKNDFIEFTVDDWKSLKRNDGKRCKIKRKGIDFYTILFDDGFECQVGPYHLEPIK